MSSEKEPHCFCGKSELVPNYRAKARNHPVDFASYYCKGCKSDVIVCDECKSVGAEWWYDLGEIWEDWHYSEDNYSLCQNCYYDLVEKGEISEEEDY